MSFSVGRVSRSIFVKLFLVLAATGTLVNVLVLVSVRKFVGPSPEMRKLVDTNLDYFTERLVHDVGFPPEEAKLKALSERLGFRIWLRSNGKEFATHSGMPSFDEALKEDHRRLGPPKPPPFEVPGVHKPPRHPERVVLAGTVSLKGNEVDYILTAATSGGPRFGPSPKGLAGLLTLVSIILVAAFFWMNLILKPLKALNEGVTQVGAGNFKYRVRVKSRDELGRLGESFNAMAGRIEEMVVRKEQLLLDVSHELRSPITRMKLALEFYPSDRTRDQIADELREMDQMLQELLEGARLESSHGALSRREMDLVGVLRSVCEKYANAQPGLLAIGWPTSCPMLADPSRLGIVFKNLIENALKHSPPDRPVEVRLVDSGDFVRVEVSDRGSGIPRSELTRVFEPFYRVDKSRSRDTGGFGLGLHLAQKIARAHGGDVELFSEADSGTIALVRLPKRPV